MNLIYEYTMKNKNKCLSGNNITYISITRDEQMNKYLGRVSIHVEGPATWEVIIHFRFPNGINPEQRKALNSDYFEHLEFYNYDNVFNSNIKKIILNSARTISIDYDIDYEMEGRYILKLNVKKFSYITQ
jgi:hypothetical protein